MLKNRPLVSFCIPTNKRAEILKKTLESFFIDNADTDVFSYEICIADNSSTNETEDMLRTFFQEKNIIYRRNNAVGFMNSIEALKIGTGMFLKLQNDYTFFKKGLLSKFIFQINSNLNTKPCMFFPFGGLKNGHDLKSVDDFNSFLMHISYLSTWSSAFGIWKDDFDKLNGQIKINNMFPHTSFLFNLHYKTKFIIDNQLYIENQALEKKGGYNITNNFCVKYIGMLFSLFKEKLITKKTYKHIKNDILYDFFPSWYINIILHKENYTFDISNTFRLLCVYYNKIDILLFYFLIGLFFLRIILKRCVLFIKKTGKYAFFI